MTENTIFSVKDCALISIATGEKAVTLTELRDRLQTISQDSIYHHFWGGLLGARFEEREFNNDFAGWVRHSLLDPVLAERLAVIDPVEFRDPEALRQELLELIEERLDESEDIRWLRGARQFEFIRSQIVVFDTGRRLSRPEDLVDQIPQMSTSSIFYHFIDARRRLESGSDDFRFWLYGFGSDYGPLSQRLAEIDPFFSSLSQIRQALAEAVANHFQGGGK